MGLGIAIKAFFKALKNRESAERFIKDTPALQIKEVVDDAHLRLLASLQRSGRLVDFLKEDISKFSDAQVGAAVRKIHADCSKSLEEMITLRAVFEEAEGTQVTVPTGYDPSEVKVTGRVSGSPPFKGILRHKGWRAHKLSLPKQVGEHKRDVIAPAEVELP